MRRLGTRWKLRTLRIRYFAMVVGCVLAASAMNAQTPASDPYAGARQFSDQQGKEWLQRGIAGLSLTVAVDGKIVYSEGFGFADLEERVPAWPTTKFRIGSISKPLTAVGLMELVEAG
ncbi:MAG TPA: serine hydrolase domain-containing protein, partial [Candidatus Acidoferrum sp.]|nr:serine hydrolase domain-containing protein [Candidatus Acidoferrum sp.]